MIFSRFAMTRAIFGRGYSAEPDALIELLKQDDAPVWYGLAGAVAFSRVYVRMHHASDVVVGAALGIALGRIVRRGFPRRRG